jgi:hypothetical protein
LTGRPLAALVAGLAFAFAPYRFEHLSHVQVLSAQWMPFVLYGFRRYLETKQRRALAGGAAALIVQNLSCGYYALFFAPFVVAYVICELAVRRRLNDWAAWRAFGVAGLAVVALTVPFLLPYVDVRGSGVGVRSLGEITRFSADAHGFATAPLKLRLWGERLSIFPRSEGHAFPGFTILTLAVIGVAGGLLSRKAGPRPPLAAWRQMLAGTLTVLLAGCLYGIATVLISGRFAVPTARGWMVWHHIGRASLGAAILIVALVLVTRRSPGERDPSSVPWAFYGVAALAAATLAMGPQITVRGALVAAGPYAWLMDYVPGFDGLRVPARYVMLVTLFLAALAGLGASFILSRAKRFGMVLVVTAGSLVLLESWPTPLETNFRSENEGLELPPAELYIDRRLPPIYKTIRDHDQSVVLLEFPFGVPAWDVLAVFYAGYHRRHLVNGYSGHFPESNQHLGQMLNLRLRDPQAAWRALLGSGTTHVLVHEAAFPEPRQKETTHWLVASGAKELLVDGTDRLFTVR